MGKQSCGGDCSCGPCSEAKSYDDVCREVSRKLLVLDREHNELLDQLRLAASAKSLRKELMAASDRYVPIGGVEDLESDVRKRLERLVDERQALHERLCVLCPGDARCSTQQPTKSHHWHKADPDEEASANTVNETRGGAGCRR